MDGGGGTAPAAAAAGPVGGAWCAWVPSHQEGSSRVSDGEALRRLTLLASMIRVLATSSGVVKPAATPPARLPQAAASSAGKSATSPEWVLLRARNSFSRSYSGNCRQVNGICAGERAAIQFRVRRVRPQPQSSPRARRWIQSRGKSRGGPLSARRSARWPNCRCRSLAPPSDSAVSRLRSVLARGRLPEDGSRGQVLCERRGLGGEGRTTSPVEAESMWRNGANSSVASRGASCGSVAFESS